MRIRLERTAARGFNLPSREAPPAAAGALTLLMAVLVGGCSGALVGDWHMVEVVPNREVFAIDDAHFERNGDFTATITIEGKTAREVGTYSFNGYKLTLRPQAGGRHRYNAYLKPGRLHVSDGDRRVVLKKGRK